MNNADRIQEKEQLLGDFFFKTEEVCRYLSISMTGLRRLIDSKEIKAIKTGKILRISKSSLDDFLKKSTL